jgi:hypothetical protein
MNDEVTKSSPWDVFINLLAVIALYVSVCGAISLLFQFANLALPDPLDHRIDVRDSARYGVSMVIVFFPVYWWAWRSIEADLAANPGKRRLWVRTCPIYLTLFLAGLLALGDLACLFYYLMSGDLTSRFLLKVVAVLVVAGGVLVFYRNALRREPGPLPLAMRAFAYTTATLAGALVIAGFVIAGPPTRAHLARLDQQRLRDLESVEQKVVDYWQDKGDLPASLDQLRDDVVAYSPQRDPASGDSYGYRRTGATSFELCADFALKDSDAARSMQTWRQTGTSTAWNHESGHYCFARTIDPARHPVRKSQSPRGSAARGACKRESTA